MGKAKGGFLTPKAIANRIKAKGLQKLRWYCQMCEKQCRDENGFKCHLMSESHQRQLLLFADNSSKYLSGFSGEFKHGFVHLLKRQYGTKRVSANMVYQEYIRDREHTHMNATQWQTLTDFVKFLGREGHCIVDETEKGWFITYIDRDWEAIKKKESQQKKDKMDLNDDELTQRFINKQVEKAKATAKNTDVSEATDLMREDEDEKIAFNMAATSKKMEAPSAAKTSNILERLGGKETDKTSATKKLAQKRKCVLDEIMKDEEVTKEKKNRKDYWLCPGIVVKVITKKLGDKYYKKKGVIKDVEGRYVGIVKMIDSGDKIKLDQEHLETVIPALGKPVMIVNGIHRGLEARLDQLQDKSFSCSLRITSAPFAGRQVEKVAYEDMSKLHQPS